MYYLKAVELFRRNSHKMENMIVNYRTNEAKIESTSIGDVNFIALANKGSEVINALH